MNEASPSSFARLGPAVAQHLDRVCTLFEVAWKDGGRPWIEDFLGDAAEPERSALLHELVLLDAQYRRRQGEQPGAADYAVRFPTEAAGIRGAFAAEFSAAPPAEPALTTTDSQRSNVSRGPPDPLRTGPDQAEPTETPALLAGAAAAQPKLPTVPGYEILSELGRGGMGVVYQARQQSLKRLVALKMILSGQCAGPQELERFRHEAEAVARLSHPHIVQIYEVGEHEGRPFFAMEYVGGGTLAIRLRQSLPPAIEAAALVEHLARALHAVHQCHVVHRDLKPANVLLAADGTPKVTDFGLSKRLDEDEGVTGTGAVMGTPSYMAPEHASGAGRAATPLADVYSLGAILYECLTGRPPFRAATAAQTLRHVLEEEAVAPRRLNPALPRDLETICLRCLSKQPQQRYASAEALAEDLRRWQEHKPIQARPVGPLVRMAKWIRRNPFPTALAAVILLALTTVVGLILSSNARLEHQIAETNQARQKIEADFLESLLLRIGHRDGPADQVEQGALWQLAGLDSDRLRLEFLITGLESEATAGCLERRAEMVTLALAGTNTNKRQEVLQIVSARFRAPGARTKVRAACARLAVHLEAKDEDYSRAVAETVVAQMAQTTNPYALKALANDLLLVAGKMEAEQGRKAIRAAAQRLAAPMAKTIDLKAIAALKEGLIALTGKFDPQQGAQLFNDQMKKSHSRDVIESLTEAQAVLIGMFEPRQGIKLIADHTIRPDAVSYHHKALIKGLVMLAGKLDATKDQMVALKATQLLVAELGNPASLMVSAVGQAGGLPNPWQVGWTAEQMIQAATPIRVVYRLELAELLAAFAAKVEPRRGAQLLAMLAKTNDLVAIKVVAVKLATLAARLPPAEGHKVAQEAAQLIELKTPEITKFNAALQVHMGETLVALAAQMEPQQGARLLASRLAKTTNLPAVKPLAEGLAAVVAKLEPAERREIVREAVQLLNGKMAEALLPEVYGITQLTQGLAALIGQLEPREGQAAAEQMVQLLVPRIVLFANREINRYDGNALAVGLAALAPWLEPRHGVQLLADIMAKTTQPGVLGPLAEGLAALAGKLEPLQRQQVSQDAAELLVGQMAVPNELFFYQSLPRGLAALASCLEPHQGVKLLCGQLANARDSEASKVLARGLVVLAARLKPEQGAQRLVVQMARTSAPDALKVLAEGLAVLSARLEPPSRHQAAQEAALVLANQMARTADLNSCPELAEGLAALTSKLDKKSLVNLLKNPLCVGEAQEVLLKELGQRTGQTFATLWGFVAWAEQHEPDLDLASPFQRPKGLDE